MGIFTIPVRQILNSAKFLLRFNKYSAVCVLFERAGHFSVLNMLMETVFNYYVFKCFLFVHPHLIIL